MRSVFHKFTESLENHFRFDARYFLSSGFWLFLTQAGIVVTSLMVAVIFANILTETQYGYYRYIVELAAILTFFSLTGMGQTVLQATAKGYLSFFKQSIQWTLFYGFGITITASLCAAYYFYKDNEFLAIGCLLIAAFQPTTLILQSTVAHLHGSRRFKEATWLQVSRAAFVSFCSIIAILVTNNIIILLSVYFVSQAISTLTSFYSRKTLAEVTEPIPEIEFRKYLRFAQNTSVRNVLVGLAAKLDTIIVFQQLGAASLAIYSISILIPDQIRGTFKNLLILLLPKYAKYETLNDIKKHIPKRGFQFFLLLVAITVLFILIIPLFYTFLFPKYTESIIYAQLLALTFPASIYLIPLSALQSQLKEKELYHYHLTTSSLQVILVFVLISSHGLLGAIIARIITQYLKVIFSFFLVFKKDTTNN